MFDELLERVRLSGQQRSRQFSFTQLIHTPIVAP
jgi:hypothetical protein